MTQAGRTVIGQLTLSAVGLICTRILLPVWFSSMLIGILTMIVAFFGVWIVMWVFEAYPPRQAKVFVTTYYLAQLAKYVVVVTAVLILLKETRMIWPAFIIGIGLVQFGALFAKASPKRIETPNGQAK
jgi:F0F1-type ATP synthase assembly protein I